MLAERVLGIFHTLLLVTDDLTTELVYRGTHGSHSRAHRVSAVAQPVGVAVRCIRFMACAVWSVEVYVYLCGMTLPHRLQPKNECQNNSDMSCATYSWATSAERHAAEGFRRQQGCREAREPHALWRFSSKLFFDFRKKFAFLDRRNTRSLQHCSALNPFPTPGISSRAQSTPCTLRPATAPRPLGLGRGSPPGSSGPHARALQSYKSRRSVKTPTFAFPSFVFWDRQEDG